MSAPTTSALHQLQSPDGYYKYLNIPKPAPSTAANNSSFLKPPSSSSDGNDQNAKSSSIDTEKVEKKLPKIKSQTSSRSSSW
jgi:hypothetical protein